jgi:hypothetical protein
MKWWVARRLYLTKQDMLDQGIDKAQVNKVKFAEKNSSANNPTKRYLPRRKLSLGRFGISAPARLFGTAKG